MNRYDSSIVPEVILTVPHAGYDPIGENGHLTDFAAEPFANYLEQILNSSGIATDIIVSYNQRTEVDMNRQEARGTEFRDKVLEKGEEMDGRTGILLDCHSFNSAIKEDDDPKKNCDCYLLKYDGDLNGFTDLLAKRINDAGFYCEIFEATDKDDIEITASDFNGVENVALLEVDEQLSVKDVSNLAHLVARVISKEFRPKLLKTIDSPAYTALDKV